VYYIAFVSGTEGNGDQIMARGPSYWAIPRGKKWEAGWRDNYGRYHSKSGFLNRAQAKNFAHAQALLAWNMVAGLPGQFFF
jgi:hypothetical protein